jgi:hypothetical protein
MFWYLLVLIALLYICTQTPAPHITWVAYNVLVDKTIIPIVKPGFALVIAGLVLKYAIDCSDGCDWKRCSIFNCLARGWRAGVSEYKVAMKNKKKVKKHPNSAQSLHTVKSSVPSKDPCSCSEAESTVSEYGHHGHHEQQSTEESSVYEDDVLFTKQRCTCKH